MKTCKMIRSVKFGDNCNLRLYDSTEDDLEIVREIAEERRKKQQEESFYLVDFGDIVDKYYKWKQLLPRVEPFYAVKCNPDVAVLRLLAHLGVSFDCASKSEIKRVLTLGVKPSRIIYAHPCKHKSYLRYAAEEHIRLMTFDNEEELIKIRETFPDARLVLRIMPPTGYKVEIDLSEKFGCQPQHARALFMKAQKLGLTIVGISFHVGSGAEDVEVFSMAVKSAAAVFKEGLALGFDLNLLDIGGGFPGHSYARITFEEIAEALNESLDQYFPPERRVRIIAEPGTYFVASAFSLTATVISKRTVFLHPDKDEKGEEETNSQLTYVYYINDGCLGAFAGQFTASQDVEAIRLVHPPVNPKEFPIILCGPCCPKEDRISTRSWLRLAEASLGDCLNFPDMGAYTLCIATLFCGMPYAHRYYCCDYTLCKHKIHISVAE